MSQEQWDEAAQPEQDSLSLEEMDALVVKMKEAKQKYQDAKDISDLLYAEYGTAQAAVLEALENSNRTSYITGAGTRVTVSYAMSVQTPKSADEKKAFFEWLRTNKGDDVADAYMTVNSNALNSLYNELTEEWARKGEVLQVDGLGEPVSRKKLSVRG